MAVFTKTYVQCDLCEAQRELPVNGEGWYRVEVGVTRLSTSASPDEKMTGRTSDICQSCYGAVADGEFSSLFTPDRDSKPTPKIAPVS